MKSGENAGKQKKKKYVYILFIFEFIGLFSFL